jgi:hypothetical protein
MAAVMRAPQFAEYHSLQCDIYGLHLVHARNPEVRNVYEVVHRAS